MLRETIQDLRGVAKEMPGFTAAVLLATAVGAGLKGAVVNEADSDHLSVHASRLDSQAMGTDTGLMSRMRTHLCDSEKTPGFTVIVALRQYSLELSVPTKEIHTLIDDARVSLIGSVGEMDRRSVA